jgi:hypothetical protein
VNEHVLTAVIADHETESLLRIEEFDDALAFANDLRGHAAAATEATASAAATEATASAAAVTKSAAATKRGTIAESAAATKAAAILKSTLVAECLAAAEKIVALVAAAPAAVAFAPSVKTHLVELLLPPVDP